MHGVIPPIPQGVVFNYARDTSSWRTILPSNIVRTRKPRKRWLGLIAFIGEARNEYRILSINLKKLLGEKSVD
jgi:hypothetical protein